MAEAGADREVDADVAADEDGPHPVPCWPPPPPLESWWRAKSRDGLPDDSRGEGEMDRDRLRREEF